MTGSGRSPSAGDRGGLARFAAGPAVLARARAVDGPRCELCAEPITEQHAHVVDVTDRRLLCTCRPCGLLFTRAESGGGRIRAVPDRVLRAAGPGPTLADWEDLQIPVGIAFFLSDGSTGAVTAFYPSPAGATQCLLDLAAWRRWSRPPS